MDPTERFRRIEEALGQQQEASRAMQDMMNKLLTQLAAKESHSPDPIPPTTSQTPTTNSSKIKPASPSEFDGDRSKGRAFLNSVNLYIALRSTEFADDQVRICWTLSFMKTGRAAIFADQTITNNRPDNPVFSDWKDFERKFIEDFYPYDEKTDALMKLESTRYFQGRRTTDVYIDEFTELTTRARCTDPTTLVLKFRRGLDPSLQDKIAESPSCPEGEDVDGWLAAARRLDRNRTANEAFRGSFARAPSVPSAARQSPPVPPKRFEFGSITPTVSRQPPTPAKTLPMGIPMDIDASKQAKTLDDACRRCGETGHWKNQCPRRFDIRYMDLDEREALVQEVLMSKEGEKPDEGFQKSDE
jgi:Retrotransposon gag protein/Zinc knuckle